jgi:hypothetical protein
MENDILKAIELLKVGQVGKVSATIYTLPNAVVFRDVKERNSMFEQIQEVIIIKTNEGVILGNSSRMQGLEDQRYKHSINPARVQRILSEHVTMIPFTVFKEAGLDLLTCSILDSGPAETLKEKQGHKAEMLDRHFTGARLFKALTKNRGNGVPYEAKYFLVDADRREIEHGIINFFLAEIPVKVETIEDAYLALKPKEVSDFESETGLPVDRQGEFFFLPVQLDQLDDVNPFDMENRIDRIQVGNSRPNYVQEGFESNGRFFVRGKISHSGREHADLHLGNELGFWFKVVPNTSKANFQLTGDID